MTLMFTENVTLPVVFPVINNYLGVAIKKQLPGLSISETLVEIELN